MEFFVNDEEPEFWINVGEGECNFVVPPDEARLERLYEEQVIVRPSDNG
jgi:hypothetical protein